MLAKILEDMWVEPEVLEALSEEQKRILFLKMREEQVRRWREREEREGHDCYSSRPKKASQKHVSWLLGRDGDVLVSIIGEMDEFRSSKLLQNIMNNRLCSGTMNGIQTEDLLSGSETQQLSLKEDIQLPLTDVTEDPASPSEQSSEEDAEEGLKEPEPEGDSDSESGSSSDNLSDWAPHDRAHFSSHGNQALKAQLSEAERARPQDRENACWEKKQETGGRVAQLRKAFTDDPHQTSPACTKPPLPAKPAHLQRTSSPMIR
ncbi:SH2 domain-containing protein 4A [Gouania willdenowi]|uniref:SH2 domain-containing protein 4A-like n=1 Tax=Gouania willdenowi TaxID=441366 RepID=A0A8C5I3L1_GOUWI|nr:SH2 domain-containing protein 4A-like [Gouania willdenowi]